jgi:hypothetical protein
MQRMDLAVLFLGHMVGDYIFQADWQAANKIKSSFACLVHCVFYTLGVFLVATASGAVWPVWAWFVVGALHFPVDRFRLARRWMLLGGRQAAFVEPPFGPWSVVVVDNTIHLLVLYALWLAVDVHVIS